MPNVHQKNRIASSSPPEIQYVLYESEKRDLTEVFGGVQVLVFAARHNVSDERMEFLTSDRLGWLRFPGFQLDQAMSDSPAVSEAVNSERYAECCISRCSSPGRGILPVAGRLWMRRLLQLLGNAPRIERNKTSNKANAPDEEAQKDVDARWTVKFSKGNRRDIAT
ncbi:MAG: hypothetical protein HRT36_09415 [Alphaproteobacteria bacterium]|nr:hypothetical protein [Alphaproteobacteria bacterium]